MKILHTALARELCTSAIKRDLKKYVANPMLYNGV